jgi:putative DNA primase/helicase
LKKLSGGDQLHAEVKYGAEFNFWPTHKLWFMFNHQPRVRDHSIGFWRRVRLIPFVRKFEGDADDKNLDAKLDAEREGILTWLVRACVEWQEYGLSTPSAVLAASKRYEDDEDPLGEFIQQHVRSDGSGFYLKDAFWLYNRWVKENQIQHSLGRNRFGTMLESRGFRRVKRGSGGLPYFENGRLVWTCTCLRVPCVCLSSP